MEVFDGAESSTQCRAGLTTNESFVLPESISEILRSFKVVSWPTAR